MTTYARSEVSRDGESGGETPSMAGLLHINFLAVVVVVVFVVVVFFLLLLLFSLLLMLLPMFLFFRCCFCF